MLCKSFLREVLAKVFVAFGFVVASCFKKFVYVTQGQNNLSGTIYSSLYYLPKYPKIAMKITCKINLQFPFNSFQCSGAGSLLILSIILGQGADPFLRDYTQIQYDINLVPPALLFQSSLP